MNTNRKSFAVSILAAACFIIASMLMPSLGAAQLDKVKEIDGGFESQLRKTGSTQDRRSEECCRHPQC